MRLKFYSDLNCECIKIFFKRGREIFLISLNDYIHNYDFTVKLLSTIGITIDANLSCNDEYLNWIFLLK